MNLSKITDPQAKAFIEQFLRDREINKEFFKRVPEEKFDFRIVETPKRKSDSVRESLAHQIDTTRDYINGVKTGILKFGIQYEDLIDIKKLSKKELLKKLEETEEELIEILSDPKISEKKVKVPWSKKPIPSVSCL